MLSPVWNRISLTTQKQSPEPTPEQAQKQDLRLFLKVVHQEIKLEIIVWLRKYLFHDHDWIIALQEELHKFERNKMCPLVSRLRTRSIIETKWLFKNKLDKVQNSS